MNLIQLREFLKRAAATIAGSFIAIPAIAKYFSTKINYIEGVTFKDQVIRFDGPIVIENCKFDRCKLMISGPESHINSCIFNNCEPIECVGDSDICITNNYFGVDQYLINKNMNSIVQF